MKKKVLGICLCACFMAGCQLKENNENEKLVVNYENTNKFKKIVSELFETTVGNSEVFLDDIEKIIQKEIDSLVERMEAEGSIVYKSFDDEVEIKKGIEGRVDEIKYIANNGDKQFSYILNREQPMVKLLKKYDDINDQMHDLNKIKNTDLQEKYIDIMDGFDKELLVEDVEEILGYKFGKGDISEALIENEPVKKMYSYSEDNEGIIVQEVDGRINSIRYNNIPTEGNIDVRNYFSGTDENGIRVNSIEVYSGVDKMIHNISFEDILK